MTRDKGQHQMKTKRTLVFALMPMTLWGQASWSTCASGGACWTGGNVGIGTASPQATLDLNANIPVLRFSSGYYSYDLRAEATYGTFRLRNTDSENDLVSVQHGGNVGIGTSSPGEALEVNGAIRATFHGTYAGTLTNSIMLGGGPNPVIAAFGPDPSTR